MLKLFSCLIFFTDERIVVRLSLDLNLELGL